MWQVWPQIGVDIVGLRLVSAPKDRDRLVAVFCQSLDSSELFTGKCPLVMEALAASVHTDDSSTDREIGDVLQSYGGNWAAECFCILSVTEGVGAGVRAVGVGSNVKKRTRAARLALAAALEISERWGIAPDLQSVVQQAERAMHSDPRSFLSQPVLSQPPQAQAPWQVQSTQWNTQPQPQAQPDKVASPYAAGDIAAVRFPTEAKIAGATTSALAAAAEASGAPRECVEDPAAELRPWSHNGADQLWPYCTACNCWSDLPHLYGQRHQKALRMAECCDQPQAQPEKAAAEHAGVEPWGIPPPKEAAIPKVSATRQTSAAGWLEAGDAGLKDLDVPPPPPGQPSADRQVPPPPPPLPPPTEPFQGYAAAGHAAGRGPATHVPPANEVPMPSTCRWRIAEPCNERPVPTSLSAGGPADVNRNRAQAFGKTKDGLIEV